MKKREKILFLYLLRVFFLNRMKVAHDTHFEKPDQFRLHNGSARKQSKEVNRISRMFPSAAHSKMKMFSESESQRPENLTQKLNGTEIG